MSASDSRYMELTAKMARLEAQIAELKRQQARKEEDARQAEKARNADESKLEKKTGVARPKKTEAARPRNLATPKQPSNSAEGKTEGKRKAKEAGGARKKRKTAAVSGVSIDSESEVFSSGSEDEKHERMEQAVDEDNMMVDSEACDLCRSSGVASDCVWPDENTKATSCRRCIDQKKPCKVSGRPVSQQKATLHQLSKDMDDKAFGLLMVEMTKSVRDSTYAMKGLLSSVEEVLGEFMGKN